MINKFLSWFVIIQVLWIIITTIIVIILSEFLNYLCELNFIWFDLWVGIYIDTENNIIYINPLPTLVWRCEKIIDVEK